MNTESVLLSVKKMLGIDVHYDYFDTDIIIHINSVLMILRQLGVGPEEGCMIDGVFTTWSDIYGDIPCLEAVRSYVYMKVKMMFDPPMTSSVADAMNRTIAELEYRICLTADLMSKQQ